MNYTLSDCTHYRLPCVSLVTYSNIDRRVDTKQQQLLTSDMQASMYSPYDTAIIGKKLLVLLPTLTSIMCGDTQWCMYLEKGKHSTCITTIGFCLQVWPHVPS